MGWIERELYQKLHDEFRERGFYDLSTAPVELADMPNGFKNREEATKYLEELAANYNAVGFKNMLFYAGKDCDRIVAVVEILVGSVTRELVPVINVNAWYKDRRLYSYKQLCERFVTAMHHGYVDGAIEFLFEDVRNVVCAFQRDVTTWIVSGRWPEENFIKDIKLNY